MQIDFLYFEDCPSHETALERLQSVLTEAGIDTPINIVKVETESAAQQWRFVGSPTIRFDGADIVPPPDEQRYYLACRVYQLEDGRFSPLPSLNMIREGLQRALQS